MLYSSLLRPWLFKKDPEDAHHLAMSYAKRLAASPGLCDFTRRWVARPNDRRPRTVAGLTFPNPVGLAAGMDKDAVCPLAWYAFGFGFMELGTVTPRPQPGKPRPRMFRYPDRQAVVNRMGFNNAGMDAVAASLAFLTRAGTRPPIPIGISIGKNLDTPADQAAEDYGKAAHKLAPYADYLAINVSSPNTAGLRDLQSKAEITRLLRAVELAAPDTPVFVKIAPELEGDALKGVLDACADSDAAAGVIATNTLSTKGMEGLEEGGLSGQPLRILSAKKVEEVRRLLPGRLAIIGCGGINDAPSAQSMLNAGADLIQLYTALVYEGPLLPAKLSRALAKSPQRPSPP